MILLLCCLKIFLLFDENASSDMMLINYEDEFDPYAHT
jgi:hypothetical protein